MYYSLVRSVTHEFLHGGVEMGRNTEISEFQKEKCIEMQFSVPVYHSYDKGISATVGRAAPRLPGNFE
jgi:hypothetical protein